MTAKPTPAIPRLSSFPDTPPVALRQGDSPPSISTRRCPSCRHRLHQSAFGRQRHRVCELCRAHAQAARRRTVAYKRLRDSLGRLSASILARRSPDILLSLCETAAAHANTDLPGLAKMFGEHLLDPLITPAQRLKIARTIWHMHLSAMASVEPPSSDPDILCRQLHADHKLIPVIRRLLEDGTLGLDDIDPPPG